MPRYLVERSFPDGLVIPRGPEGGKILMAIVSCNGDRRVTWVNSYVADDARKTFCIYEAPNPESIRMSAMSNGLPVDQITQVSVLDPYAYHLFAK